MMVGVSYYVYISLNIFLAIDLTYELKSPLSSKGKRIKMYYLATILLALVPAIIELKVISLAKMPGADLLKAYSTRSIMTLLLLTFYLVVSLGSLVYSVIRIKNSGLSTAHKKLILVRHLYWILVVSLSNAYLFFLNMYIVVLEGSSKASN
jgi:hypothetical protein